MEMDPHQLIEGMIIAGNAVGSHQGYIYCRGEYRYVLNIVDAAIEEAYARGYLGKNILGSGFDFDICRAHRRGRLRVRRRIRADGIARRQARLSAHPASLPCRRGTLRLSDGDQQRGDAQLRAESLSCGAANGMRASARPKMAARACFAFPATSTSPGIYELPMGFNLKRMIEDVAGGMLGGKKLKAVIPGGSSCPLLKRR